MRAKFRHSFHTARRRRQVGTIVFVSASVINFVAFAFAPASILAPLESLQFVSNLLFGKIVNKVPVTRRMLCGCGAVIAGTVLAVALGPSGSAAANALLPVLRDSSPLLCLTPLILTLVSSLLLRSSHVSAHLPASLRHIYSMLMTISTSC